MSTPGCDPIYPNSFPKAVGFYRSFFTMLPFDSAILAALLPPKLELGPQSMTPAGTHPLVLLFGKHFDVRPELIPFGGMSYLECIIAIPNVQWRDERNDYRGPFAYMPRLYLDELWPTLLGYLYAYPKLVARMEGRPPEDPHYRVRSLVKDNPLIHGEFLRRGPQLAPTDWPNFANVRGVFEQPFIGKLELSPYTCSKLTFKLDQASVQPCSADVDIEREFLPGVEPASYLVDGIDVDALGSFYIAVPWELTLPFGCSCIGCK